MAATSNLLEALELLQSQTLLTGRELAQRLGVDRRTVRRYVTTLQGLGIPVEGERGVGGGYRLRPGYRLPPLMFGEAEAVAVVLGLVAAQRLGFGDADDVRGALGKIHRVLPDALRLRVEALEAVLGFSWPDHAGATNASATVLTIADAARRGRRVRFLHRSLEREVSPFGVVLHGGHWYLAGHDHLRGALRTFRAHRISDVRVADAAALETPAGFDAVQAVRTAIAQAPWAHAVEVELRLPLGTAQQRLRSVPAELEAAGLNTRLRMRVDSLDWMASVLAGLECDFTVVTPDALRDSLRDLAHRLEDAAGA